MEDWEEPYFTEEAWSNGKKFVFIVGCGLMVWAAVGLCGYYLYQMI